MDRKVRIRIQRKGKDREKRSGGQLGRQWPISFLVRPNETILIEQNNYFRFRFEVLAQVDVLASPGAACGEGMRDPGGVIDRDGDGEKRSKSNLKRGSVGEYPEEQRR